MWKISPQTKHSGAEGALSRLSEVMESAPSSRDRELLMDRSSPFMSESEKVS